MQRVSHTRPAFLRQWMPLACDMVPSETNHRRENRTQRPVNETKWIIYLRKRHWHDSMADETKQNKSLFHTCCAWIARLDLLMFTCLPLPDPLEMTCLVIAWCLLQEHSINYLILIAKQWQTKWNRLFPVSQSKMTMGSRGINGEESRNDLDGKRASMTVSVIVCLPSGMLCVIDILSFSISKPLVRTSNQQHVIWFA